MSTKDPYCMRCGEQYKGEFQREGCPECVKKTAELPARVARFIADRRESEDGSWPQITDEDLEELYNIIALILDSKFECDCDGDRPIPVPRLTVRKREQVNYYRPIPHYNLHDGEQTKEEIEAEYDHAKEIAASNLSTAARDMDMILGSEKRWKQGIKIDAVAKDYPGCEECQYGRTTGRLIRHCRECQAKIRKEALGW